MRLIPILLAALLAAPVAVSQSTFQVTVVVKTEKHPANGRGHAEGYAIDGVEGADLTLVRGRTYTFQMSGVPSIHPFGISTSSLGGGAGVWTEGVVGDGATGNQTLTFTVPATAPDLLWYQCGVHQQMGWRLTIVAATGTEDLDEGYSLAVVTENPARDAVGLALRVPVTQRVRVEAFTIDGRRVAVLLDDTVRGGAVRHVALGNAGEPAGVYVVRAVAAGWRAEQRVTLAR